MQFDPLVWLAGGAIGVLGLGLCLAWLGLRRLMAAERLVRDLRQEVRSQLREATELKPLVLQMGERLSAVERRAQYLGERQQQVEARATSGPDYDQAIRMAKAGAAPDEIMRQCGLGQNEARLIVSIHGLREG
ncbi:DUF2802 domain-containing protein [Natronospira sp.]|uniref:DUF2802 domain-containing protein n=1 Tax=Natronospira sp. TaxID=2024970 RepID=UPI0038739310